VIDVVDQGRDAIEHRQQRVDHVGAALDVAVADVFDGGFKCVCELFDVSPAGESRAAFDAVGGAEQLLDQRLGVGLVALQRDHCRGHGGKMLARLGDESMTEARFL
jgi:hypothetical protein